MKVKKFALSLLSAVTVFTMAACSNSDKTAKTGESASTEAKTSESSMKETATQAQSTESTEAVADKTTEKKDLVVFAAASMTEVLDQIKTTYEKENPNINLTFNLDSSGTLKTQIDEGADADVFISAAQKQMDQIDQKSDKVDGKNFIDSDSRFNLLENKVTLVVSKGNPKAVKSFEDLGNDTVNAIALGNQDVPVGQYSQEILTNLGIWDKIQDKVTLGSNVKEVTTWVSEGTVDCGIVYATDAKAAGLEVVATADGSMLKNKVVYPAAVLANSTKKDEAKKFLDFLKTDEASKLLENAGFTPLK